MAVLQKDTWGEILRTSSWLTVSWDWFMTLLGRAVEPVLWMTLIYSCYQLIPGATMPPAAVTNTMFVLQFIALDIGGAGLLKMAEAQELPRGSYPRVLAYTLIGVTLVTVAYAGLQHVVQVEQTVTTGVEVALVVIRSVLTVLYGQAIHSMKQTDEVAREKLSSVREQIVREQATLNSLRETVKQLSKERDETVKQRDDLVFHIASLKQEISVSEEVLTRVKQSIDQGRETLLAMPSEAGHGQKNLPMKQRETRVSGRPETQKPAHETRPETPLAEIETLLRQGNLTVREIAVRTGVSPATVSRRKQAMKGETDES